MSWSQATQLIQKVTEKEVYVALTSIGVNKAPGLNGYGSLFYRACWNVIKVDVMAAVREFFEQFKLLHCFELCYNYFASKVSEC